MALDAGAEAVVVVDFVVEAAAGLAVVDSAAAVVVDFLAPPVEAADSVAVAVDSAEAKVAVLRSAVLRR